MRKAKGPRDQMATATISMFMAGSWDERSRDAAAVLVASGYLADATPCRPGAVLPESLERRRLVIVTRDLP